MGCEWARGRQRALQPSRWCPKSRSTRPDPSPSRSAPSKPASRKRKRQKSKRKNRNQKNRNQKNRNRKNRNQKNRNQKKLSLRKRRRLSPSKKRVWEFTCTSTRR